MEKFVPLLTVDSDYFSPGDGHLCLSCLIMTDVVGRLRLCLGQGQVSWWCLPTKCKIYHRNILSSPPLQLTTSLTSHMYQESQKKEEGRLILDHYINPLVIPISFL